jgi:hypothetical protein
MEVESGEVLDFEAPQPRSSVVVQMFSKNVESLPVIRLPMSLSRNCHILEIKLPIVLLSLV